MGRRKSRLRTVDLGAPAGEETAAQPSVRRRRRTPRWRTLLGTLLIAVIAIVTVAPWLLHRSGMSARLLANATRSGPLRVQATSLAGGWWQPLACHQLKVFDAQQRLLLSAETVRVDRSLWQLIRSPHQWGTIRVEQLEAYADWNAHRSNWEEALAPWLETDSQSTGTIPEFALELVAARLHLDEMAADEMAADASSDNPHRPASLASWQVDVPTLTLHSPRADRTEWRMEMQSQIMRAGQPTAGRLSVNAACQLPTVKPSDAALTGAPTGTVPLPPVDLQVDAEHLPLAFLTSIATRFGRPFDASGLASGQIRLATTPEAAAGEHHGTCDLHIDQPIIRLFEHNQLSEHDATTVSLQQADVQLRIVLAGDQLQCQPSRIVCDLGELRVQGNLNWQDLLAQPADATRWIAQPMAVQGHLDVAAVARCFPDVVRLREDTQLLSGQLEWTWQQTSAEPGNRGTITLQTRDLVAERQGEQRVWRDPLALQAVLVRRGSGWFAESLHADASFLELRGSGDTHSAHIRFTSDLDRLAAELRQFFDLGPSRIAGRIQSELQWNQRDAQAWDVQGTLKGQSLELTWNGQSGESFEQVDLRWQAAGRGNFDSGMQATEAGAELQLDARDRLRVQLRDIAASPAEGIPLDPARERPTEEAGTWVGQVSWEGELARWHSLAAHVNASSLESISGQGTFTADLAIHPTSPRITLSASRLDVRDLRLRASGLGEISEPSVRMTLAGSYDGETRAILCQEATLTSSVAALRAQHFAWPIAASGNASPSQISYRCDLARLQRRIATPSAPALAGLLTGTLDLRPESDRWQFTTRNRIENLLWTEGQPNSVAPSRSVVTSAPPASLTARQWHEPELQWDASGSFTSTLQAAAGASSPQGPGNLHLDRFLLRGEGLHVSMQGTAQPLQDGCPVQVRGETELDWDRLMPKLRPWVGPSLAVQGVHRDTFALNGPLRFALEESPTSAPSPAQFTAVRNHAATTAARPTASASALVGPALRAELGVGWQEAHGWGFDVGTASVRATLAQQIVGIASQEVPVSGGKLLLAPQLELRAPFPLRFPPGPVADRVAITPAMCQQWMKYVAPLLADTTAAQGQFSATVAHVTVPLQNTAAMNADGALIIHQAQVGPGPVARDLLGLAQQIRTLVDPQRGASRYLESDRNWIVLPEQSVPFRVESGRVSHRGLTMLVGDVTIRTEGWVGFNQQLSLVAEIPIQDAWVADQRYLAGLRGQSLKVPIFGTIQQPQLDRRALESLTRQAVRGAAEGLIQDELQKQLQRLFSQ